MTGSPNNTVSRLDEFLAAAKGESASLAAQKAKPAAGHSSDSECAWPASLWTV